jgi:hypothetical protein
MASWHPACALESQAMAFQGNAKQRQAARISPRKLSTCFFNAAPSLLSVPAADSRDVAALPVTLAA